MEQISKNPEMVSQATEMMKNLSPEEGAEEFMRCAYSILQLLLKRGHRANDGLRTLASGCRQGDSTKANGGETGGVNAEKW